MLAGCGPAEDQAGLTGTQSYASPLIADEGFWMGVYQPFNNVILAERDGIQLVANGNLALSFADSDFEGTLDAHNDLDTFRARVGLDGAMTMEVAVEGSGALDSDLPLATIALPSINFGGDVVTVTPYVQVRLLVTGTAAAAARVSLVAPFHVGATFSKEGRRRTDLSSDPEFTAEVGLPQLSGNFDGTVQLEVTTTFLVSIQGFEVGGPVVGPRLGAHLQVALAPQSTWTLDGLVSIVGGWAFRDPTTGLPDVPEDDHLSKREFPPRRIADGRLPELGPSTRWSSVFEVERHDVAATALLAGGEIVVVESEDEPWLASLGTDDGVPSWQRTAPRGGIPKAMARAQNGDLLVVRTSLGRENSIECYAPSGTPRWRTPLAVSGAFLTLGAILASSWDDTIISSVVEYDDGTSRPILAALDASGNLRWSKEIETGSGSSNAVIEALAETPSGGILAVGKVDYSDTGATIDGTNALVLHLDADGNPGAAYAVGGSHAQDAHHVAVYPDGSYVIAGEQDAFAPHMAWIASLRADDSLRWSASYQSRPYVDGNGEQTSVTNLAPLDHHGLLVSGHIGAPDTDAFVIRIGEKGMPFWSKTYKSADDDRLLSVLALPDGLIAFGDTGFTEEVSSYADLWVIRCAVDGMVPFPADSGFVVENSAVQWTQVDHGVFPLAPAIAATSTMAGSPAAFTVTTPNVIGELLTD